MFGIATRFHRSFKRYGGLLTRREIETHYGKYRDDFESVRMLADAIIDEKRSPKWGIVHFDYIKSDRPNAIVKMYGPNNYLIGLCCGCVPLFQNEYTKIIGSNAVLGEVIDSASNSCTFVNRLLDDFKRIRPAFLMYVALCFYIYHEFSHIIRGHIDFLKKTTGIAELAEYTSPSKRYIKSIVSQAMEIDADFVGAMSSLHLTSKMMKAGNSNAHNDLRFFNTIEGIGYIWSFVVGILFGLIEIHDKPSNRGPVPTHPDPKTRGRILLHRIATLGNGRNSQGGLNRLIDCMKAGQEHAFGVMLRLGASSALRDVIRETTALTALSLLENELDFLFSMAGPGECRLKRGEGKRFLDPL